METITKQTYKQAVDKVVNFWIEKSFNTPFNQNNGDDSEIGGMAFLLMNMVASKSQNTVTPEKVEAFRNTLTQLLLSLEDNISKRSWLDVDYHPCQILSEAAEAAGIDGGCFPCKTTTRIDPDNVASAKYQYGGKWYTL